MFKKFIDRLFVGTPPKFSLEKLQHLHVLLQKNQRVTEQNSDLVVETLRSIAELMIWGDQHNPAFFEYFLEKGIFTLIFQIFKQDGANFLKKQLIQTVSIMIQNMNDTSSLYFILSNNHINEMIRHKFSFEDEELLDYYITFLKTISLKLNKDVIQFFYNIERREFPLYTEAIKYFHNHDMHVRIAVRTITLNIYSVNDPRTRKYVMDTAPIYLNRMTAFMKQQFFLIDSAIEKCESGNGYLRNLQDLVAEQLDHIYYLNDIFHVNMERMNQILQDVIIDVLLESFLLPCCIAVEKTQENQSQEHQGTEGTNKEKRESKNLQQILQNSSEQVDSHPLEQKELLGELSSTVTPIGTPQQPAFQIPVRRVVPRGQIRPSTSFFFLAQILFVFVHKPLAQYVMNRFLLHDNIPFHMDDSQMKSYRSVMLDALQSSDDACVSAAASLMHFIVTHKEITKEMMIAAGILPRKLRKTNRLLNALVENKHSSLPFDVSPSIVNAEDITPVAQTPIDTPLNSEGSEESAEVATKIIVNRLENSFRVEIVPLANEVPGLKDIHPEQNNVEYPFELVGVLLKALDCSKQPKRIATLHIILKLLIELLSPSREDPAILHPIHTEIVKSNLIKCAERIRLHLEKIEIVSLLQLLEVEQQQFRMLTSAAVKPELFFADPAFLFSEQNKELKELECYRRLAMSDIDIIRIDLHSFLVLSHVHCGMNGVAPAILELIENMPKYELKSQIAMVNREVIRCNMFEKKDTGQTMSVPRYVFFEDGLIYVVSLNLNKMGFAVVRSAIPMIFSSTRENSDNRYTMFLTSEQRTTKGNTLKSFDEVLVFDDFVKCKEVRTIIDKNIAKMKEMRRQQLSQILQQPFGELKRSASSIVPKSPMKMPLRRSGSNEATM